MKLAEKVKHHPEKFPVIREMEVKKQRKRDYFKLDKELKSYYFISVL